MKKKIKPTKGASVTLRVFPNIGVATKGNEVRMGKGKGTWDHWATRVRQGKVVFEIGGGGIRQEIAKQGEHFSSSVWSIWTRNHGSSARLR